MLFDPEKQIFASKLTSNNNAVIEIDNNIIFSFMYDNQHVVINIHHIIDNGSILFTKLKNVYSNDVLQIIPFVLLTYFGEKYSGYNFFILYSDDVSVFNTYNKLLSYMPPVSYLYEFKTYTSSKYMYRCISNKGGTKITRAELIEYMDEML